jgi:hypothetical protein
MIRMEKYPMRIFKTQLELKLIQLSFFISDRIILKYQGQILASMINAGKTQLAVQIIVLFM